MRFIFRTLIIAFVLFLLNTTAYAQQNQKDFFLTDLDVGIEHIDMHSLVADNRKFTAGGQAPNIPDSAFEKPWITANQLHMYLGLASLGFAGITGITSDTVSKDNGSPNLLSHVHVVSAKAAWQLGALAVGTGLWTHWNDFHIEDGLFDRDNLHVLLGTLGTLGYFLAVNSAVSDYNKNSGVVTTDHATYGMVGGALMLTAIALTW